MTIIVLSQKPIECAQFYADADVMERPLQYSETLYHAYVQNNGGPLTSRHVMTKWASSPEAWWWLLRLTKALLAEQLFRFGETCESTQLTLAGMVEADDNGPLLKQPRFLQWGIDKKIPGDAVGAFREWYHEAAVPCWTKRGVPSWWEGAEQRVFSF